MGSEMCIRDRNMDKPRAYEAEYKKEAVKLAKEVGDKKASESIKIPDGTFYDWIKKERKGALETGEARTPAEALSLAEEIQKLRLENKEQAKEIKRLTELNEFLEEASAFFAARRQKSGKMKD